MAPSRTQALCEKALIRSGLWQAPVLARVHSPPPFSYDHSKYVIRIGSHTGPDRTTFNRTNRDQTELIRQGIFPAEFVRVKTLQGLKVLDLGCGDGLFVEQMRRAGVEVEGLDVFLDKYQLSKPYYIQAGADDTGEPDQSYDVIISAQGPLSWEHNHALVRSYLLEARRLLKPGGRLLVSAIHVEKNMNFKDVRPEVMLKGTAFEALPAGLAIKSAPSREWLMYPAENTEYEHANYWLELQRVP